MKAFLRALLFRLALAALLVGGLILCVLTALWVANSEGSLPPPG